MVWGVVPPSLVNFVQNVNMTHTKLSIDPSCTFNIPSVSVANILDRWPRCVVFLQLSKMSKILAINEDVLWDTRKWFNRCQVLQTWQRNRCTLIQLCVSKWKTICHIQSMAQGRCNKGPFFKVITQKCSK